jgi:hypothetical protein
MIPNYALDRCNPFWTTALRQHDFSSNFSAVPKQDEELGDVTLQLRVGGKTRAMIDDLKQVSGVSAVKVVRHMLDWLAVQPEPVRTAILYRNGDAAAELVKIKLREMHFAEGVEAASEMSPVEAVQVARAMLDRLEQTVRALDMERADQRRSKKR